MASIAIALSDKKTAGVARDLVSDDTKIKDKTKARDKRAVKEGK